jgi:hypothetical protein
VHPLQVLDPALQVGAAVLGQRTGCVAAVRAASVQLQQFLDLVEGEPSS